MILEASDLSAGYGSDPLVSGLSFGIRPGGITVLVGPNAAGKSTILRALLRYGAARLDGELRWHGERIADLRDPRVPVGATAWMRQERPVFEGFTVREFAEVGQRGRTSAERARAREALLELLPEVRPWLERRADQLSGGERALACLFATLASEAAVLLLDEPAANLDIARGARMCEAVRAYVAERRAGALVIEHRPEAVQALGGDVVGVGSSR